MSESEVEVRTYEKPRLTVYGSVKSLTMGVGGSNRDMGQPTDTKKGGG